MMVYVSGMIADVRMCVQMKVRLAYARCNVPTLSDLGAVRLDAVGVDPETQAHARVDHEIEDGTT